MQWIRGQTIGCGSFSTVNLVVPNKKGFSQCPPPMAVKSCENINSDSLKNEKEVLDQLGFCPQIIRCFGDEYTVENDEKLYNLFLEYANKGSLADQVKKSGGNLVESDVRRYARSILEGLRFLHAKGFAHCDIKLQNILLFGNGDVKIADFGLAKRNGKEGGERWRLEIRGTPLNIAPESVNENEYDSPVDIWALGCAVVEMFTGKSAWNFKPGTNVAALLIKIGVRDELPAIPAELSEQGKDFLRKCFVKDPKNRWTAEMLLDHPFMAGDDETIAMNRCEEEASTSPKCSFEEFSVSPRLPFDFPYWVSTQSTASSQSNFQQNSSLVSSSPSYVSSPLDRIRQLACDQAPNWSVCGSWITLR
ncbi:mitogen-activated protein kinase kinase kinase 18-like [Durio zibethinus]|uniref:Mitogen-activated protein kinase kinase kinase 18-like n=1 Tax=Durio zibethinus TaxID=66656 RepID=A0A6P5X897_DURZI|nr:mitogen-activated protein kinase kinase kinase 18-like [Durio zibethinus]